ncbi:hypothetical protein [Lactovum odontotermitis]
MKKRTIIIIASILIPILIIGGIIVGFKMNEQQTKNRQIAFLKAHEQEMTEYVKAKNSKIKVVTYDWSSLEISDSGEFTEELYNIDFYYEPSKYSQYSVSMSLYVDDINEPTRIVEISIPDVSE